MAVTDQDRDAMKKILGALDGNATALSESDNMPTKVNESFVEVTGPGVVTTAEVTAMSKIMNRLSNITSQVITESKFDTQLSEAIQTNRNNDGVKVGNYQIMIKEDQKRLAGKQYYSIYHTQSGDTIAADLSLYEVALNVVKHLNNGRYVNSSIVRKLFDADDRYTASRTDAIRFKSRSNTYFKNKDFTKSQLYENRYQASVTNAMSAKKEIKELISEGRRLK